MMSGEMSISANKPMGSWRRIFVHSDLCTLKTSMQNADFSDPNNKAMNRCAPVHLTNAESIPACTAC